MSGSSDKDYPLFIPTFIALALFANYWMWANDIRAGLIFGLILLITVSGFVFGKIFLKNDKDLPKIAEIIDLPFADSLRKSVGWYFIGLFACLIFSFVGGLLNFSVTSFSIPLFGSEMSNQITQSFSAAEISSSMPWKLFNIVFNAGISEEIGFAVGFLFWGLLIGLFLYQLLSYKVKNFVVSKQTFVLGFAIFVSVVAFALAHDLNNSYTVWYMFLAAGVFRLVTLVGMYGLFIPLSAFVGYHQMNNLIWLVGVEGFSNVARGFVSPFGILFGVLLLLMGVYWFRTAGDRGA